jgi:hypothetical protein
MKTTIETIKKALLAAIQTLEEMVSDEYGEHICDNDGRGCYACGMAQNKLDEIIKMWEGK